MVKKHSKKAFDSVLSELLIILGAIFLLSAMDVEPVSNLDGFIHFVVGIMFVIMAVDMRRKLKN